MGEHRVRALVGGPTVRLDHLGFRGRDAMTPGHRGPVGSTGLLQGPRPIRGDDAQAEESCRATGDEALLVGGDDPGSDPGALPAYFARAQDVSGLVQLDAEPAAAGG